jgi:hypothetical protein
MMALYYTPHWQTVLMRLEFHSINELDHRNNVVDNKHDVSFNSSGIGAHNNTKKESRAIPCGHMRCCQLEASLDGRNRQALLHGTVQLPAAAVTN